MSQIFNAYEIFKISIQIEKNGKNFYSAAAEETRDEQFKKLFTELADWESKHVTLFEKFRDNLPSEVKFEDVFDPDNLIHLYLESVADSTVFIKESDMKKTVSECESIIEILEKALEFEKDSVVFYSSMRSIVPDDLGKAEIDKLIQEELFHVGQLTKEIKSLK